MRGKVGRVLLEGKQSLFVLLFVGRLQIASVAFLRDASNFRESALA